MAQWVKNLPARFDSWAGKIHWRRAYQPSLVFLPGELYGKRSLAGYSSWIVESDMTEATEHTRMHSNIYVTGLPWKWSDMAGWVPRTMFSKQKALSEYWPIMATVYVTIWCVRRKLTQGLSLTNTLAGWEGHILYNCSKSSRTVSRILSFGTDLKSV